MSEELNQLSLDYQRIEKSITYIEKNFHRQPTLKEIANSVFLSEFHFQRLFSRWVGISPKRFLQYLTKEHAKKLLKQSRNILDVSFETGLSSPGRLHDLFVTCEAVTPGEFKNEGETLTIDYGIQASPFGDCLLAITDRGICELTFVKNGNVAETIHTFEKSWQKASINRNEKRIEKMIEQIFSPSSQKDIRPLNLILHGTNFQIKVWEALLKIPAGYVASYEDVAHQIGKPKAVRAVANAVAANPIAYIIPCHRVIRKIGDYGGYQSGRARKKAILGWEAARYGNL